jgi:hypothetical protein
LHFERDRGEDGDNRSQKAVCQRRREAIRAWGDMMDNPKNRRKKGGGVDEQLSALYVSTERSVKGRPVVRGAFDKGDEGANPYR